jgi:primosomal protein N' (replication factor Y)
LAARHDYEAFAAKELPIRRELHYPPFGRLAYVIVSGLDSRSVGANAAALAADLRSQATDVEVLGPAPDVLAKAKGEFRERIALKSAEEAKILEACAAARKRPLHRGVRCTVIVDPR